MFRQKGEMNQTTHQLADRPERCRIIQPTQNIRWNRRFEKSLRMLQAIIQRTLETQSARPWPEAVPETRVLTMVTKQIVDVEQIPQAQALVRVALKEQVHQGVQYHVGWCKNL